MKLKNTINVVTITILSLSVISESMAAIALDRTRVVFNGGDKSTSMDISNQNKELPYLAQGWIEDEQGNKINGPLVVTPPVQRVEPGAKSQVKIESLPTIAQLPQDRESVFYFNLREIPPRSKKPNTLQIALQTRIKLFYRPKAIFASRTDLDNPWQEKMTLTRQGDRYQVNNPTPYYITVVDAASQLKGKTVVDFKPLMIAPKSNVVLSGSAGALGSAPVLTYVNDYGGRPQLIFSCSGNHCQVAQRSS
ncbi:fimbria/pilus periplasmic chaperone [Photorhabdus laumondii subsp. laumondii]|uniref:Fimbria/pilus periplasmic chaperone n=1 Tax=Photorhabdus laumondii subsp. laumondii TaxID=141679 RepID=A0A6L9JMD9_PHOLM|nr:MULTISPECIES: fimbria/pilus periplasmic chaperone [Photorhabdus]MCC8384322.1 fimbria/pilus periplasmic chaperone [Photorhabdus laumondii]MCC8412972.1 fimbria/pilus periplasmic chaperone [Photorhabdus laumondii]NDK94402.1 fimbria/pilus periplasmic chaperone [Photorhabdus laumondii subsp. laumondii]NDL20642.1 fimbria/pilus periplasmic chaperone [Photorhabdus laumondii subsp. laumondii]NDL29683.1 fimbria/pilus periplasmic chaperone [Photorhabdus laumondii subsp. laumondii]